MYILLAINGLLIAKILYLLFPYIDYGLRNNQIYKYLRNKIPFIKNYHDLI